MFKVISLCAGLISAMIVWLYTVEYNNKIASFEDLFAQCALTDLMTLIAILIIMCTCYFLILYTQRRTRMNEILMRKLYGDNGRAIVFDLMIETLFFIVVSFLLSLVIIDQIVPFLNILTGKEVWIRGAIGFRLLVFITVFLLIVELTCGVFPAYMYSKIRPVEILRKKNSEENINS